MVFLGPRANAELVPKFYIALHASHAALPMVTLTILLYTNVTLNFDFGLDHPVQGGYGWGHPAWKRKKVIVRQRKLKSGHGPYRGPDTKMNWPTDHWAQYNLTWTGVIELQITDPSSRQRGRPTWRRKNVIVTQRNVKCGHLLQREPDTKTNCPTVGRNITWTWIWTWITRVEAG
jgi:hypothetical protein